MIVKAASLGMITLVLSSVVGAENLASKRRHLSHSQKQVATLQQANHAITRRIEPLAGEIEQRSAQNAPEARTRDEAHSRYEHAKKVFEDIPSLANRKQVEHAKFAFLMADRRYARASRSVHQLQQQLETLQRSLNDNMHQLDALSGKVDAGRQQIAQQAERDRHDARKQAESERQQRIAKENALRREQELARVNRDHAAAIAEVERLQASLGDSCTAPVEATRKTAPTRTATAAARATTTGRTGKSRDSKGLTATLVHNGKRGYHQLLRSARTKDSGNRKAIKKLNIKSYDEDRVLKQTSHWLRHVGNGVYQGKSIMRAGKTEFLVDGKHWINQMPRSADKTPYVFLLDSRNTANPQLLLFARSDLE